MKEKPPTLQDLRKRKFPTIKAFAEALGVSPSTASAWLRGDYSFWTPSGDKVWHMRELLGVDAPAYYDALGESRKAEQKKEQPKR